VNKFLTLAEFLIILLQYYSKFTLKSCHKNVLDFYIFRMEIKLMTTEKSWGFSVNSIEGVYVSLISYGSLIV
jgi:hypothetical protein